MFYNTTFMNSNINKKTCFYLLITLITIQHCYTQNGDLSSNYEADHSNWDLTTLDTARDSSYLTKAEKDVILELNMVRTNPSKYADLYLKPMLSKFSDNVYDNGKEIKLLTNEGKSAVEECISVLKKQQALSVLYPDQLLSKMAKYHANLQGKTTSVGHNSPNGKTFSDRLKLFSIRYNFVGENISYGYTNAREIVIQLIVDDGVPSRGHRNNVFNKFNSVGISIATHLRYNYMCVQDFRYYNPTNSR